MKRYNVFGDVVKQVDFSTSFVTPKYDDIVDASTWSPSSDAMANRVASVKGGASGQGVYDDADNLPSDLEVRIRSGKLDKAEVDLAIKKFVDDAKKEADEKKKADDMANAQKIADARQTYLDNAVGFKSSSEVSKS